MNAEIAEATGAQCLFSIGDKKDQKQISGIDAAGLMIHKIFDLCDRRNQRQEMHESKVLLKIAFLAFYFMALLV